jgi:hypothetical protein
MLSWKGCLPFFLLFHDNNKTIKHVNLSVCRKIRPDPVVGTKCQVGGDDGRASESMHQHHRLIRLIHAKKNTS